MTTVEQIKRVKVVDTGASQSALQQNHANNLAKQIQSFDNRITNEDSYISTTESTRAPILRNYPSAMRSAINTNASVTTGKSKGH